MLPVNPPAPLPVTGNHNGKPPTPNSLHTRKQNRTLLSQGPTVPKLEVLLSFRNQLSFPAFGPRKQGRALDSPPQGVSLPLTFLILRAWGLTVSPWDLSPVSALPSASWALSPLPALSLLPGLCLSTLLLPAFMAPCLFPSVCLSFPSQFLKPQVAVSTLSIPFSPHLSMSLPPLSPLLLESSKDLSVSLISLINATGAMSGGEALWEDG